MKRMTLEQKNLLKKRIADLYGWMVRGKASDAVKIKDTPEIKKARALVQKFDQENAKRASEVEAVYEKAAREASEAIAFKEASEAYAYVMALKPIKT